MDLSNYRYLFTISVFLCFTPAFLAGCKKKDMSLKLNEPRNIRGVVSYKRSFPDLNDKHLEVAKTVGIRPLEDREEAESMKEKLTHITDNEFYVVDSLTHSIPYLVPRASALLDTIGSNFLDSLAAKGLNPNQVIVTSVLRTQSDVCVAETGTLPPTRRIASELLSMLAGNGSRRWRTRMEDPYRMSAPIP